MSVVTIVLADDHPIVRHGLRTLLEAEPDFAVVGEVSEGAKVMETVARLAPRVLVLDVMIPDMSGLEVARQVSQQAPHTRVLILSMYRNEAYVLEALRNGAVGYVLKSAGAEILVEAVRVVAGGRRYLCPSLSERAIEVYVQKAETAPLDVYETLTLREREVLCLVAAGYKNAEVAEKLSISVRTVEVHRTRLMQKLDLRTQADLIRFALRRGLLPQED
jgi:DNA-binding NarL/FixJ family response regulator